MLRHGVTRRRHSWFFVGIRHEEGVLKGVIATTSCLLLHWLQLNGTFGLVHLLLLLAVLGVLSFIEGRLLPFERLGTVLGV